MTGPTFELRRCCPPVAPDDPAPGGFIERVGEQSRLALGPTIAPTDPPRPDRPTCHHEAAHAAATVIGGGIVREIVCEGGNPHVGHESALSPVVDSVMLLTGPAAEGRARGFARPHGAAEVAALWRRVNAPSGGRCDFCNVMRHAILAAGLDREEEATRLYRAAERLAHAIIWHPEVERVIRIATHELMRDGRMDGARFHTIAGDVIAPETIRYFKKELEKCWQSSEN
ncbi:MAG: hypothetical protein JNM13_14810 [Hyphomicrobiaceae bacterium]|nr:hypothetical protein [Hyphomicrobiaceae bacterium]